MMDNNNIEINVPDEFGETLEQIKTKNTLSTSWNSQPPTNPTTPIPTAPTLPQMEVL